MLSYALNVPVHWSTKLTTIGFFLSWPPPIPAFATISTMSTDDNKVCSPLARQICMISSVTLHLRLDFSTAGWKRGKLTQQRYKSDRNKKARSKPEYAPGVYNYVYRPLLTSCAAERLAAEGCSNFPQKKSWSVPSVDGRAGLLEDPRRRCLKLRQYQRTHPCNRGGRYLWKSLTKKHQTKKVSF